MATWSELVPEIAAALGVRPEQLPGPGTRELMDVIGRLHEINPDLAERAMAALIGGDAPQTPTFAAMSREATRARVRERFTGWIKKRDPTQPKRRRINRTLLTVLCGGALVVLLITLQARQQPRRRAAEQPHASRVAAQRPAQRPAPSPAPQQPSAPTLPNETTPGGSTAPAAPRPSQPPSALTPGLPPMPPAPSGAAPGGPAAAGPTLPPSANGAAPGGATVVAPQEEKTESAQVIAGDASVDASAKATVLGPEQPQTAQGAPGQGSAAPAPGGATVVAPPSPQAAPAGTAASPSSPHFQVGDQFTVVLSTPVAISTGWQAIPAVAVATTGPLKDWKLVGQASLAQDGTPQIAWTQALSPDGKTTLAIHGVAYNPANGVPGVAGVRSRAMTPQAARTVLSGALAAVGQYVNAQLEAQQTEVSGLTATITSQVPPFWQFVASQLATGFQPGPVQTGGTVLVSELPKGLPITVFITQGS
jgi:hypothetical protein